jgi:putative phosphoribosyl transferase
MSAWQDSNHGDTNPGKIHILSRSHESFVDRNEAGYQLASALSEYQGKSPVILGIPRGGIVIARELSRILGGQLDVVLAHKLGTPGDKELAMGSVSEDGKLFLNEKITALTGINRNDIEEERIRQLTQMRRRTDLIRKIHPKVPLKDRIVILTDDGVATGATTQAAIWAVKIEKPQKLVLAVPVGPEDTIMKLADMVDEIVCLRAPPAFGAVGQFYQHFYPVEDEDMLRILSEEYRKQSSPGGK